MTKAKRKPEPYVRKLLREFEAAVRDHAFKGASCPDDWQAIEDHYQRVKSRMWKTIDRLANNDAKK